MSLEPGTRLGPYEIVAAIGAGGMGEVYTATDTRLDRTVAIKVLPAELASDPDRRDRFEREAKAIAALNHPYICTLHEFDTQDGVDFLVMEHLEGESLQDRLQEGPLPLDQALRYAGQIADALDNAHRHGITHRDLKPGNIMLTKSGAKLLDFGLAKLRTTASVGVASITLTASLTEEGTLLGTLPYMAPEQIEGADVDARSDIWALGVTLYEMLTGRRAFSGDSSARLMSAILRDEPATMTELEPSTPPALHRTVRQCFAKDPDDRWQAAGDLKRELQWIAGNDGVPAGGMASPDKGGPSLVGLVAGAVMLVVFTTIAWWAGSRDGAEVESWSQFTQLTDNIGAETAPSISPDGDSIAYASKAAGSWDIYLRRIGGRNSTIVAGDPDRDESAPAFSLDGRTIAFHESDSNGGIFIVGATGESVRRVTETGFHPAWSPDGQSIAFCDERIIEPSSRLITSAVSIVDVATGDIRVLTNSDAVQPAWSPSGHRVAYWGQASGQRDIFTISSSGGDPVAVTEDAALDWSVTWAPDGKHLYFASNRGGAMNLWRIAIDEASGRPLGDPEPITAGVQAAAATPSFSADGLKLVFQSSLTSINPAAMSFDPLTEEVGEPRFLLRQTGRLVPTSVSADGQWLAYGSPGNPVEDIFVSRLDGSELRRLTDDAFLDRLPVWSPAGAIVTFFSNRSGSYEIWSIRGDGSGPTRISDRPGTSLIFPFYEPSGERLWTHQLQRGASVTLDLGGPLPRPGVEMPVISVDGGTFRAHGMSRDGTRLAGVAVSAEGARFGVGWHDLESGETWISTGDSTPGLPAWLPDGQRLVFATDGSTLEVIDVMKRRRVVGGPFDFDIEWFVPALSPDGRTIVVAARLTESDIWMVERQR